ncbi:uncharacterized protein LOC144445829 [Glandiceps talaboti]
MTSERARLVQVGQDVLAQQYHSPPLYTQSNAATDQHAQYTDVNPVHVYTQQPTTSKTAGNVHELRHLPASNSTTYTRGPDDDYLAFSILNCLFCFWVLGLIAIIKSCEVRRAVELGDFPRAHKAAKLAKDLNITATIAGFFILAIVALGIWFQDWPVIAVAAAAAEATTTTTTTTTSTTATVTTTATATTTTSTATATATTTTN